MNNHGFYRVAIVGRPNVGKSTLFNRLMKERIAITDPIPGATRDAIARLCRLEDKQFLLLDTGGCRPDAEGELEELAIEKSMAEATKADLILLMVDANELTGEDYLLVDQLRRYSNKIILVANKCDSVEKELLAGEMYALGFGQPAFISAEHNRNLDSFLERLYERLPAETVKENEAEEEPEQEQFIRIAILGRPNAGKSSLANQLCGEDNSIVSSIAGTTRDTVISSFKSQHYSFEILDTAGLRRKSKLKERLEYYSTKRTEHAVQQADVVFLVYDVLEGLTDQDKKIADIIVREKKPFIFVLNKWDLKDKKDPTLKQKGSKNDILNEEIDELRFQFPVVAYIDAVAVSAEQAWGMDHLLATTVRLYKEYHKVVNDFDLNEALREWAQDRPPARRGKSPTWFKSLRQTGHAPSRFVLRVHGHLDDAYIRYITNRIRQEFGFKSVPILLEVEHV